MAGQIRQAVREIVGPNGAEYISVAVSEEVSATVSELARMTGTTEDFISRQLFEAAIQEAATEVQTFFMTEGEGTPRTTVELAVLEGESGASGASEAEGWGHEVNGTSEAAGASGATTKPKKGTRGTRGTRGTQAAAKVDGQFVKQLRTEASLSQRHFAQHSGISLDAVRRIENNTGGVRRPTIQKLAKFFGISEEALLVKS